MNNDLTSTNPVVNFIMERVVDVMVVVMVFGPPLLPYLTLAVVLWVINGWVNKALKR